MPPTAAEGSATVSTTPQDGSREASRRAAPRRFGWDAWAAAALALGMIVALCLQLVAIRETQQARRDVDRLLRSAERASRRVRGLAADLARLRALALETYTEAAGEGPQPPDAYLRRQARAADAIGRSVQEHLTTLDTDLPQDEVGEWLTVRPTVVAAYGEIMRSLELLGRGQVQQAEDALDAVEAQVRQVDLALASLRSLTTARAERVRAGADYRLARVEALEMVLAVALALVLTTAGLVAVVLQRRRQAIANEHLRRVEAINAELDQFAARVAHDLRGLLSPLGLSAELLARSPTAATANTVAPRLTSAVQRAARVLDALLTFSRAGKAEPGASAAVEEVAQQVRAVADEQAADVGARIALDVTPARVACDGTLLGQVLTNLVENAIKHLHEADPAVVRIEGRRRKDGYQLVVSDTGPGIPPDVLPRLFVPFSRGPDERVPGLGLGLATVRRVVEAHGGRVAAASPPGGGARFTIVLPLASAAVREPARV